MEIINGNYFIFPIMLYMIGDLFGMVLKEDEVWKEYVEGKQHQIVLQEKEY